MGAVYVNGTEEIEERIRTLAKNGLGDFEITYAPGTGVIESAVDGDLKIHFINDILEDELDDEYWANDAYRVAEMEWRQ